MASIICADDDESITRLYQNMLGSKGYQVRACASGAEALAAFAQQPADLVILDLLMPGLSGLETCRELRKRPEAFGVPIIMVSGVAAETSIFECLSSGADDYVLKPMRPAELNAKVASALARRTARLSRDNCLRPGTRFADRFDIRRQIAGGGFSMVFQARDIIRDTDVALKVFDLPPARRADNRFVSTFLHEAYQLSRLDHPVIVKFYDFGQCGELHYLVMEYVEGRSLEELLQAEGALNEARIARIGRAIAGAIQYLDRQNMLHRDIKPPNILITGSDVKLLDFGLARSVWDTAGSGPDELRVTPFFAPPEIFIKGEALDTRSDIYSLGATLYYGASKILPFDGATVAEVIASHFAATPTPLCLVNPAVSKAFSQLIEQMLARRKDERPGIDEVLLRLGQLTGREGA
jgi:DNA-binding response OmpR family regulator